MTPLFWVLTPFLKGDGDSSYFHLLENMNHVPLLVYLSLFFCGGLELSPSNTGHKRKLVPGFGGCPQLVVGIGLGT